MRKQWGDNHTLTVRSVFPVSGNPVVFLRFCSDYRRLVVYLHLIRSFAVGWVLISSDTRHCQVTGRARTTEDAIARVRPMFMHDGTAEGGGPEASPRPVLAFPRYPYNAHKGKHHPVEMSRLEVGVTYLQRSSPNLLCNSRTERFSAQEVANDTWASVKDSKSAIRIYRFPEVSIRNVGVMSSSCCFPEF